MVVVSVYEYFSESYVNRAKVAGIINITEYISASVIGDIFIADASVSSVSVLPVFRCFSDAEPSVLQWHQCQCFQFFSDQWHWSDRCALGVSVGDKSVSALSICTDTAHP